MNTILDIPEPSFYWWLATNLILGSAILVIVAAALGLAYGFVAPLFQKGSDDAPATTPDAAVSPDRARLAASVRLGSDFSDVSGVPSGVARLDCDARFHRGRTFSGPAKKGFRRF